MPKKLHSLRKRPTRQELRDMDQEILFLEGLVRRDESYVEALQILGDDYTRRGRYAEGLNIDERLCKLRPDDALVRYNLACSYSLTNQLDLALDAVETALNLGYRDFKWMAQDPDLENLRKHSAYKKIQAMVRQIQVKRARTI
jgi:tetratricopeptide (TPR) repeat protein